jgi:hypothetical protein
MSNVKKMLETAWNQFKSDYKDAEKCEEERGKGERRTARRYAYLPWNEFDARFVFARKIEGLYAKSGSKAEIHVNWDISMGYESQTKACLAVRKALPRKKFFDLVISQPCSAKFDALMEFKMYRGQPEYDPWEKLERQVKDLLKVKSIKGIKVTKEVAVALIQTRRGLSGPAWNNILKNLEKYEDKGLILLEFDTQTDI